MDHDALVAAAATGNEPVLLALLQQGVRDSSATAGTALEAAALEGHESTVRLLLNAGVSDLWACDENGWTALHNAVSGGHPAVARLLLEAGSDARARATDGSTPLHLVCEADPKIDFKLVAGSDGRGRTAFFAPALVQTLCSAGALVNAPAGDGSTPLHEAAAVGAGSTVLALLSNGADPTAVNADGRTPYAVIGSRSRGLAADTLDRLRATLADEATGATSPENEPMDDDDPQNGSSDGGELDWAVALATVRERMQAQRLQVSGSKRSAIEPEGEQTMHRRKSGRF